MRFVNSLGRNVLHKWEIVSLLSTVGSISKAETPLPSKAEKFFKCPHHHPLQILTNLWSTAVLFKAMYASAKPHLQIWGDTCSAYKFSCQNHTYHFLPSKSINIILTFWTRYVFYLLAKTTTIILNSLQPLCLTSLCCNGWPAAFLFLALMEQS